MQAQFTRPAPIILKAPQFLIDVGDVPGQILIEIIGRAETSRSPLDQGGIETERASHWQGCAHHVTRQPAGDVPAAFANSLLNGVWHRPS